MPFGLASLVSRSGDNDFIATVLSLPRFAFANLGRDFNRYSGFITPFLEWGAILFTNDVLYQLSYDGLLNFQKNRTLYARAMGVEPTTSVVTGQCSTVELRPHLLYFTCFLSSFNLVPARGIGPLTLGL